MVQARGAWAEIPAEVPAEIPAEIPAHPGQKGHYG